MKKKAAPKKLDLTAELARLVKKLEADLKERSEEASEIQSALQADHRAELEAGKTAESYTIFRQALLNKVAVSWVLGCVFVRYLEDNGLLDRPYLAGRGEDRLRVEASYRDYFRAQPQHSDREYLQWVFREVGKLPGCADLFAEDRNPLWKVGVSGDGGKLLLDFFQAQDKEGALVCSFVASDGSTRVLGDLYQDLSKDARERYALLQTPVFVEEFILEHTLVPAIREFGLERVTVIDPTCGSGHFLLGAFELLRDRWDARLGNPREAAERALEQVYGVDVNPFAVAIARFRLLLAFLRAGRYAGLRSCPRNLKPRVATGDSLLLTDQSSSGEYRLVKGMGEHGGAGLLPDATAPGDHRDAMDYLFRTHAAVVGNPPYIVSREKAQNVAIRKLYATAYRQFSLAVPFTERFFQLAAVPGGGFVGMITANSFMKREFGKKLITEFFPRVDLSHVLDTAGAYIPGHGTPTVILFGRSRPPSTDTVVAVMGIRGEPGIPENPAEGKVWTDLVRLLERGEGRSDFVSRSDLARAALASHPWSMGGGGAAELKELIEENADHRLKKLKPEVGFVCITRADDVYFSDRKALQRLRIHPEQIIQNVEGEFIRDWSLNEPNCCAFPYGRDLHPVAESMDDPLIQYLWPHKERLWQRKEPNGDHRQIGLTWYEWSRFLRARFQTPLSLAFAFVATHNHFVLDRGGKVFNRSAPVIKLPPGAGEAEHLALLGLLNSSLACFWLKQVCHNKGGRGGIAGFKDEAWEQFIEVTSAAVEDFPVVGRDDPRLLALATELDRLGERSAALVGELTSAPPTAEALATLELEERQLLVRRVSLQEELDWLVYELYGLLERAPLHPTDQLPPVLPGQRPFEIRMARDRAAGQLETTWFERHGSVPHTELPAEWPESYRELVARRLALLEQNSDLRLIEKPEFKRRWLTEPFADRARRALGEWLLERLETLGGWSARGLQSTHELTRRVKSDPDFLRVAALYRPGDHEPEELVRELAMSDAVPLLPAFRYRPSGLEKRSEWERVWELQRQEDAGQSVGPIPVPPKYGQGDFQSQVFWRLRGKLDVPRERFVLFPRAERASDPTPVLGWAGWTRLELAEAIASYYLERKQQDGWDAARLVPLLAALAELLPWLVQWHNQVDPEFGERMGDHYKGFVQTEARSLGLTAEEVRDFALGRSPAV